jgi:uncharacterized surface protein with fasciclin (FAS1) repeats
LNSDDSQTIAEAAIKTPSLSTFVTALESARLLDQFSGEKRFTVFAPDNDAFAKLSPDTLANLLRPENRSDLKKILMRHIVAGWVIDSADISVGNTDIFSFGSEPLTLSNINGAISIQSSSGRANVILIDGLASNGVVHVVDTIF